ncbi:Orexin receptor type 2 [Trachymyrmex septentrionalis]|uniref:Orexin receptor type 2 n=1 Tax=Trachymyrmex septentrionalis TaxID=34720 RepID=A0A195FND3_9HYME|nr:Orexin receptor type 2 [Trachymyrmex septentrionalis]
MVFLSDIRPLLHIARLFGCGLFLVTEDDIMIMKYGTIYTVLFALLYVSLCIANIYMLRWDDMIGPRLLMLTVVRTGLSYSCVLSDIVMTYCYNWKIRAALSHLRIFDRTTKYKEPKYPHMIRYVCWSLVFVMLSFWTIVGYITFCVEPKDSVFNGITYAIVNTTLTMQLITFASLSSLLYERYHRLCESLLLPEDGKIMVVDRLDKQFHLQEVWWLHSCLTNATEMINSVYSIQLLLWIFCMSFNTLTRIYTINNGAILQPLLIAREILLVSACVTNLLIITIICHMTATQTSLTLVLFSKANRVGKIAFTPSSAILVKKNFMQDCCVEAVTYFQLQQVHFFACYGIIRIDLPLLLSITMMANKTLSLNDIMVKILWDFYNSFHGSNKDYLLIILYVPTVLVSVIANIFVIIVVCKYHLKSVTNYFVINLSMADLLVATICMPMTISQEISMSWNHSEFLCKLTSYLQSVGVTASIYTIMAMSIDRYLAIRNPMILRYICSHKNIILVIVSIWLASMAFFITIYGAMRLQDPMTKVINKALELMASENYTHNSISPTPPGFNMCIEDFTSLGIRRDVFGSIHFVFSTAIPCLVVLLAYSLIGFTLWSKKPPFDYDNRESASSRQSSKLRHERKRVALILLFLAILFALCWMPYNITKFLIDLDVIGPSTSTNNTLKYFLFLGHANSALNPVVYCWMTRGFRQKLVKILCCISNNLSHYDPSRRIAPGYDRRDQRQNKDKYELKTSQLESSTLCTTDGQR